MRDERCSGWAVHEVVDGWGGADLARLKSPRVDPADRFRVLSFGMADNQTRGQESFERSRQHRHGVQQACADLEDALARPAGTQEVGRRRRPPAFTSWSRPSSIMYCKARARGSFAPDRASRSSAGPRCGAGQTGSPGPPRRNRPARTATKDVDDAGHIQKVRQEAMRLLQSIAAHRQSGADLIYEAYSVDVQGGDSG